jgi:hypothetical protein
MTLDDILGMWETDCLIDEVHLDETSINCARLHSKYLGLHAAAKLTLKRRMVALDQVRKDKWLYFNGKMTKEEMDAKNWPYDPWNGMRQPLKGDMEMFYDVDPDLVKATALVDYQKTIVETLQEIMDNIRWRHTNIKNIIEFRKFTAGV